MYIFGYGSLIWKVDFPYENKFPGYIKGYVRRFWQYSTDHRGTQESPGRVVTLVPFQEWQEKYSHSDPHMHSENDILWGMVYKVADKDILGVKQHLDYREKDGYETFKVSVYMQDKVLVDNALVYVATTSNPNFAGPCPINYLAYEIAHRRGPSGRNSEYLLELCHAIRSLTSDIDIHLNELERLVVELINAHNL